MTFEVKVDVREVVNAATQITALGKRTRKAIVSALSRAGDMGFTQVRRSLAEQTGIKQADLVHGSSGIRKQLATLGSLEYDVVAKSSCTPLSYFNPTQTGAGVSASPWGQRRVFQGAFMATVKSGHVGVWAHEAGPAQYARRVHAYYSQVNIRQLWGPSITKEMIKEPTPTAFKKAVTDNFTPRLTHELERMIAAINPGQFPSPASLSLCHPTLS
jgi:DNA-binding transcriptional regulator of glucitol operon